MSNYDTSYIKAEHAYRSAQIREQVLGSRRASSLRRMRRLAKWSRNATWNN